MAPRARRAQPLVDGELGDGAVRAAGRKRLFHPGVELAHRHAVFDHRLAHKRGLGLGLAALGEHARVDGLDDVAAAAHALPEPQGHAPGVDEQRAARAECGQRGGGLGVRAHLNAVGGQCRDFVRADFARTREEPAPLGGVGLEQQVGHEDRVVVDVAAAQVGDPGDVVDGADEVVAGTVPGHRLAQPCQLRRARAWRVRSGVGIDGRRGQGRALGPDGIEQVTFGAQADAGGGEARLQHLR